MAISIIRNSVSAKTLSIINNRIAEKLGLPVESISESIVGLGAEAAGQIAKGVKGAGEELQKVSK